MTDDWLSIDTVVENGQVHVLQQKLDTTVTEYGFKPHRSNEHRLVPLDELKGIRSNDADEEETKERPDGFDMVDLA